MECLLLDKVQKVEDRIASLSIKQQAAAAASKHCFQKL